jgi:hypothetical protein
MSSIKYDATGVNGFELDSIVITDTPDLLPVTALSPFKSILMAHSRPAKPACQAISFETVVRAAAMRYPLT